MLRTCRILLAATAMLATPLLTFAQQAPTAVVHFHDLDIDSQDGVAKLFERIHRAAVEVCKPTEGPQLVNRIFWTAWNSCMSQSVASAVAAVRSPKLSAYYIARTRSATQG
jgi:UrcA family protein